MLAKMWKKILLAVCIIACIFNLMAKLVNRQNTTVIDKQEKNQRNTESKNKTSEETQDEERKTYKYTDFVVTF